MSFFYFKVEEVYFKYIYAIYMILNTFRNFLLHIQEGRQCLLGQITQHEREPIYALVIVPPRFVSFTSYLTMRPRFPDVLYDGTIADNWSSFEHFHFILHSLLQSGALARGSLTQHSFLGYLSPYCNHTESPV
jgi:hypothetical protein